MTLRHADLVLDPLWQRAERGDRAVSLTPTHVRILAALIEAGGEPVPVEDMAERALDGGQDDVFSALYTFIQQLRVRLKPLGARIPFCERGVGWRLIA